MKNSVLAFGFLLLPVAAFISCSGKDQDPYPVSSTKQPSYSRNSRWINENSKADADSATGRIHTQGICHLTMKGDGFRNLTIELGSIPSGSIGIYSEDGQSTYFSMSSVSGYAIAGVFPGNAAGTAGEKSSMTILAEGKTYVADTGVELSVLEYGQQGQKIRGTFSGTFKRYDVDLKTGKHLEYSIHVENGSFDVLRQADI